MTRRKAKRPKKWLKRTLLTVLVIVLICVIYGCYVLYQTYGAYKDAHEDLGRSGDKSALRNEAVTVGDDPISILLMGIENYSSGGKNGRADTQIVVTLNPEKDKMTMVTVPRDTRVELNNIGKYSGDHKINSSYTYGELTDYGGNRKAVETVEKLLDVPIDKFVAVDFAGFRDVVNALGGVTVDIKHGFWEENIFNDNKRIYFKEGNTKLDGEEALAFARMRKRDVNTIYSRDERQRQFIKAAIHQTISAGTIFKVDDISNVLGEHVNTNLGPREIYALQKQYSSMSKSINTLHIDGQNQTINGSAYFVPDENSLHKVGQKLRQLLGVDDTTDTNDANY
ncbi:LCP family protein [Tuberibacillus sp. Marseille-P3662]|uniref:LCP family protein n=1 Tax=Tuberibacillus sp. Marseille-P3662 TaxID=1965358 RepID=UPI0020CAF4D2|nr:LCP family protein [Tuberibacillus sp. Marseille-P3662]